MEKTAKIVMEKIKIIHKNSGISILKNTPISSPLYPGQFCYCLDEMQWFEKYGNFVDIAIGDNFQKIQPAIRMRDFENFYCRDVNGNGQHLGLFTLATIAGGKVIGVDSARTCYEGIVRTMLDFFIAIGLDQSRIKVTYFSGNTASNIEMSRKKEKQERKVLVDAYIDEDCLRDTFSKCGLMENQLEGVDTRDNYLTSNWYNIVVPWGYRNEFLYLLPNGQWLDIGTIERLNMIPIITIQNKESYVVNLREWDRSLFISVVGLERLIAAIEEADDILYISLLKLLKRVGTMSNRKSEALRILHRVFTDVEWKDLSKSKRGLANFLFRSLENLPLPVISDFLQLHAGQYEFLFPELFGGIERTLAEIEAYRKRAGLW